MKPKLFTALLTALGFALFALTLVWPLFLLAAKGMLR